MQNKLLIVYDDFKKLTDLENYQNTIIDANKIIYINDCKNINDVIKIIKDSFKANNIKYVEQPNKNYIIYIEY